jgi:translation initiation factor IF-3
VIDDTGQQLGIMPPQQALVLARSKSLDLVEVAATANPPVCRIMDFGKYQYQEQKRQREARKHQKVTEVKEIKFRPKVDEHDYLFKKKHIERFLADGDKVKATIFFRGREMAHPEIGRRILERLMLELEHAAIAENVPRKEGNTMHVILARKPGWKPSAAVKAMPRPTAASSAVAGDEEPDDEAGPIDETVPIDEAVPVDEAGVIEEIDAEEGAGPVEDAE